MRTTVSSILVTAGTGDRAVVSATDQGRSAGDADTPATDLGDPGVVLMDSHEIDLSLPLAAEARSRGVPVVLDCGSRKPHTARQLAHVDVAVVSERFARTGAEGIIDALRDEQVRYGAVTAGGEPLTYFLPGGDVATIDIPKVRAVDTLGAGDFFHGALAFAIARGCLAPETFARSLAFAADVAALSVQQFGSRSWLDQLRG